MSVPENSTISHQESEIKKLTNSPEYIEKIKTFVCETPEISEHCIDFLHLHRVKLHQCAIESSIELLQVLIRHLGGLKFDVHLTEASINILVPAMTAKQMM